MISRILGARLPIIVVFCCLLSLSLAGASRLSIDPNNRVFFGKSHPHFSALEKLESKFGSNTSLVFLIVANDPINSNGALKEAIRWLTKEAWSIDRVVSVNSVSTYPHVTADGDELFVDDLLEYVCPAETKNCLHERLAELAKPHLVNRYVGSDLRSFSVVADIDLADPETESIAQITHQTEQLKADFQLKYQEIAIFVTGGVPMMQAFYDAAEADSRRLIVIALAVLAIGLYVFLGGVVPTLLMILLGAASVTMSMGVAGWAGLVVNTATATVPLIVFTLVVAAAMHVFLHIVREDKLNTNEEVKRAVARSIAANWRPVLLTAATTAVGLLSMVFVSAPPLKEVGLLAATGVVSGAIFSLTVFPCFFSYLSQIRASNFLLKLQQLMNAYAKWLERRRPRMIIVAGLFALALVGLTRVNVDEDFVRYFSADTSFRHDTESITKRLAGPYHIDVVYDSGDSAGIYSGRSVDELQTLKEYLASDPRVVNVTSIVDVLSEMNSIMNGASSLSARTPEELAEFFLSYELSLGVGQTARGLVDSDQRSARVSVLLSDVSMKDIRELDASIRRWAEENSAGDRIVVTGEGIPTAFLSSESIREMSLGIALSILISALLVGFYFKNLRVCLAIFVATIVPISAGFGLWGWLGSDIGMAATLVIAITIGVVVDDTIHLTYRYVDSVRNLDLMPWGAIAYSVHKTGTAIFVTSLAIIAGLLILLGSEFRMNSTFGICSSVVIALALVYNLTIAPAVLRHLS